MMVYKLSEDFLDLRVPANFVHHVVQNQKISFVDGELMIIIQRRWYSFNKFNIVKVIVTEVANNCKFKQCFQFFLNHI